MGSSDRICAVSHLPIQYKEPCRMIFLRQVIAWDDDLEPGDWQHVWTQWLPVGLPVRGLYDSYGHVMAGYRDDAPEGESHHAKFDRDDPVIKFMVESIARVAQPLPEKEGRGDLKDFPNTIESLMAACERGWLRVTLPRSSLRDDEDPTMVTLRVSPYYVSERAWQAMVGPPGDGIGMWRPRIEKYLRKKEEKLLMAGGLKATIDHYRDWPERREHLREALAATKSPDEIEEHLALFERIYPLGMRELSTEQENMPDIAVIGGDWRPDLSDRRSLYDFADADWERLDQMAFELRVFYATLKYELFRHVHPELHSLQFHVPDGQLDAHRMLATYIQKWCQDIEDEDERERQEWEEQQAAKEQGEG